MWTTYAVKTLYRTEVKGEPISVAEGYSDEYDMIEERVVTIKARSMDDAIDRGEKEAEQYILEPHINPFGHEVHTRYTGIISIWEPYDTVTVGVEVFSNTYLVHKTVDDRQLARNVHGPELENERELRLNFQNSEFSGFR